MSVIRVENLSKKYRIGANAAGSDGLRHVIHDLFTNPLRMARNGHSNINQESANRNPHSEEFWALKDVSFEVEQGEVVGIIGRNGAGKSTLLKILSRITEPTTGRLGIRGRVASLLEVGTGFHPELTGRENVFLNGAILGMTRQEIKRKFDEIVAFAEIEKFIDTPVKRYSSGMYVRLAFAVAAHLEPEILIVDEVLAVGDVQFQKKCMGKMGEVSRDGRTVLFVSHQLGMVSQLCNHVMVLEKGRLSGEGGAKDMIAEYLEGQMSNKQQGPIRQVSPKSTMYITEVQSLRASGLASSEFGHTESVTLSIKFENIKPVADVFLGVTVSDPQKRKIFTSEIELGSQNLGARPGTYVASMRIPAKFLAPGHYYASVALHVPKVTFVDQLEDALSFSIVDVGSEFAIYGDIDYGCVLVDCNWDLQSADTLASATFH